MADILRQVRFGGIDIEEEGGKSEKGNRERAANRRRNYCGVIKSQCSHAKNGMWIRGFPRLPDCASLLKWKVLAIVGIVPDTPSVSASR